MKIRRTRYNNSCFILERISPHVLHHCISRCFSKEREPLHCCLRCRRLTNNSTVFASYCSLGPISIMLPMQWASKVPLEEKCKQVLYFLNHDIYSWRADIPQRWDSKGVLLALSAECKLLLIVILFSCFGSSFIFCAFQVYLSIFLPIT